MINVYIYKADTGQILRSFYTTDPEMVSLNVRDGEQVIAADESFSNPYVANGALAERPENPATLSGTVIESVPAGATVSFNGQSYTVEDGTAELSFPFSGTYTVTVARFPYLTKEFEVEYAA